MLSGITIQNPGKSSPIRTIFPVIGVAIRESDGNILEAPKVISTLCPFINASDTLGNIGELPANCTL